MKALTLLLVLVALFSVASAQRQSQPIPTYVIEIRGAEVNGFTVTVKGKITMPDGKVTEIESHPKLPATYYINADCSVELKITTEEKKFRVTILYEHNEVSKWLSTAHGLPGSGVEIKAPPYEDR